ncbi:hypothetical protein [Actinoplanes sp. NPDC051851]|uniref:hypothetical protein n=1 Tax=Actinoplanes sp. NPDC051851 TaxID=3154753 RepID=UPI00343C6381
MTTAADEFGSLDDSTTDDLPDLVEGPMITANHGQAATNVGTMTQYITNWLGRYRAARELSPEFVASTMDTFVEREYLHAGLSTGPMRSGEAASLLREYHCVLLVGSAESGRRTAAVALLSHTGLPMHELPVDDDVQRLLRPGDVAWDESGRVAYLVVVPRQAERSGRLVEQLAGYRAEVERRDARLVVLLDREAWLMVEGLPGFGALMVGPPDPGRVLERLLRDQRQVWEVDRLLHEQAVAQVLRGAGPGQVLRLYRRIMSAAGEVLRRGVADPVPVIAEEAVKAYQNWDEQLVQWFEQYSDPRARLFLIALAFLEGEPAGDVLDRSEKLGKVLDESADLRGGVGGMGIRRLARCVGAEVDGEWRIRFTRAAYASSVLSFVHGDQSKEFRRKLWEWAAVLPMRGGPPHQRIAVQVADAMLMMNLSMPSPNIPEVRFLVYSWWRHPALRPLVTNLITVLALSPEAGSVMRRRLLQWATEFRDPGLLAAVAAVCAGPFADTYPQAAFTRLRRLAARESVDDDVVAAIVALWPRPAHRRAVLQQVVGLVAEEGPQRSVGLRAFAAISVVPSDVRDVFHALAADDALRGSLIGALMDLFTPPGPQGEFRQALEVWLEVAVDEPAYQELIAGLFVLAGRKGSSDDGVSARYAMMNKLLDEWQPVVEDGAYPGARDFRDWLCERLHRADPLSGWRSESLVALR